MGRISARLRALLNPARQGTALGALYTAVGESEGVMVAPEAVAELARRPPVNARARPTVNTTQRVLEGFEADWAVPVSSSNLDQVAYDTSEQTLRVSFKNGGVYDYMGVPVQIAVNLVNATSPGGYLAAFVKQRFVTRRVV